MVERIIFLMNDVCNTSSPKLVFSLCNHLTTAFRAGVAVPPADVHTAALRAQASCLTVEGWSHLTYYPSNNNVLHSMTIKTFHRDYLLLKQSSTVIYLCLISTRETQHFSTLWHIIMHIAYSSLAPYPYLVWRLTSVVNRHGGISSDFGKFLWCSGTVANISHYLLAFP